jgi:hypothetical protein
MWGAALFLITIVMVTPSGRGVVDEYARQIISLFSGQSPFPDVALALMALSALASILVMLKRRPAPAACWVWREIHEEVGGQTGRNPSPVERSISARNIY